MSSSATDTTAQLRCSVYLLLAVMSAAAVTGRILAVNSVDRIEAEKRNVQAYVEARVAEITAQGGTPTDEQRTQFVREAHEQKDIQRPFLSANDRSRWATVRSLVELGTYEIDEIVKDRRWDTIDMVQHMGKDGQPHRYSSKPPLLATLMAGPYWLIYKTTGATLGTHPYEIGRAMLIVVNVIPFFIYLLILGSLAERFGLTDWGRIFMVAAAAFGTFLTTFAISLNNHLLAAFCVSVAVWAAAKIWHDGDRRLGVFALAGFFAASAFVCELPALAFLALMGAGLVWKAPKQSLLAFAPAALVVVAAQYGTIYIAHSSFREPYAHRSETDPNDNWYRFTTPSGKPSYWSNPGGIDKGDPSASDYALHTTIGHHGILSLTPLWMLTLVGLVLAARDPKLRGLAAETALLTAVCLGFYLSRSQVDRNFGGMTSGLRWMFWFAPLWLVCLLPAADRLSTKRWGRGLCLALLFLSVMSASYPIWNPWTHPWITNFMLHMKWIEF